MTDFIEIIDFWFSQPVRPMWFQSTPEFDAELRQRYEPLWESARVGAIDHWENQAEGALALVIVLDQFPLNMYRGLPLGFSTEAQALKVSLRAIQGGLDLRFLESQKAFLYMPFMHSEDLADQTFSVSLFGNAGLESNLRFARHHHEIIQRFGRFPHRNRILGRESTAEEIEYLNSREAFNPD